MADPKQKSTLTLAQIDEALKRILGGEIASVNGINPNLLDNWYFVNPVNQRGKTEYSSVGYTIDRWAIRAAETVALANDGLLISAANGAAGALSQYLSTPGNTRVLDYLKGKTVTLTTLYGDGTLVSSTGTLPKSVSTSANFVMGNKNNYVYHYLRWYTDGRLIFDCYQTANNTEDYTVLAVKLELGFQQTLAHQDENGNWVLNEIPDYSEQLLKCQRYYQLFSSADARPSDLADYRPSMRANPAIGTIDIGGKTYYFADANL